MYYGAYVPNLGPYGDARVLADLAYEAEEAGWNGFFLWDQVSKTTLTPAVDPKRQAVWQLPDLYIFLCPWAYEIYDQRAPAHITVDPCGKKFFPTPSNNK